ncbi:isoprenylcysteine carboxylmethyltransferase family protein [Devosia rhodophyticola]|uniref:Isoprenylcysteine carboxylmethyltransferase family protein n=1 Tax=Devosia rhodophyticola TaxID=3026423 RepID=A0ABY7YU48_9HYPH|nr:isoprenylcysteine carboxylmethyltransferase family protein [Devosia rhodophyticola]WDR04841.1 isoprenylcysteine carboxylmethyltransferase family protein [Devosia rhodophyticola]
MSGSTDSSGAVVQPPIGWGATVLVGLALGWLYPLPFMPVSLPNVWIGIAVFAVSFALAIWAITTIRKAGSRIEVNKPTTTIVTSGPFGFTRNPVYVGMLLGQAAFAIGFNDLWLLAMMVPLYFLLRYGVIAREESYLERKFGQTYLDYKSTVRRWI